MQNRGAAVVQCDQAAGYRRVESVRIRDPFAMSPKRTGDLNEASLLALTPGAKPGLERIRPLRGSIRIDPLNRRLHRLPPPIVEDDRQDRELILLRHGVDGIRR